MPFTEKRINRGRVVVNFEPVIGLEVHVQLATRSKIWCSCEIKTKSMENHHICEVCAAQPGTLPVINKEVINFALKTAFATNSQINDISYFDRKSYFYPDLPKGYQITQYKTPIAQDGFLLIDFVDTEEKQSKKIGIERIQIEEDTGKSTHSGDGSLINLNRCGTPLLEIVSRPDIRSVEEAISYLKKLHSILRYLEVCHGKLQEGNFRCDVNVSLRKKGTEKLGTRTEVKNLNSFKFVEKAILFEMDRQAKVLESGKEVIQETLGFNLETMETVSQRKKSDAHDYRYFPEPDLLPLVLNDLLISEAKKNIPELPDEKSSRFQKEYGLSDYDAKLLTGTKELAFYFEEVAQGTKISHKKVANWVMVELLRLLNESGISINECPVSSTHFAELLNFIDEGKISGKMAKDVFEKMFDEKKPPSAIISAMGVSQLNDEESLMELAKKVVADNPTQVAQYKSGKDRLFGFFVGQVMKLTKGQANPQKTNEILKKLLK